MPGQRACGGQRKLGGRGFASIRKCAGTSEDQPPPRHAYSPRTYPWLMADSRLSTSQTLLRRETGPTVNQSRSPLRSTLTRARVHRSARWSGIPWFAMLWRCRDTTRRASLLSQIVVRSYQDMALPHCVGTAPRQHKVRSARRAIAGTHLLAVRLRLSDRRQPAPSRR
ncbi:MAG: hypothetical protein JWO42_2320 [Chloroflexi bacterium]|jgi:hypothetical protein|nr:hypothetical protein [Chloroflexota bacterium]